MGFESNAFARKGTNGVHCGGAGETRLIKSFDSRILKFVAKPCGRLAVGYWRGERTMPQKRRIAFVVSVVGLAVLAAHLIQGRSAGAASPFKVVPGWGQLTAPLKWGEVPNVAIDPKGTVFVFTRSEPPVVELNAAGKMLKTWG